MLEDYGLDPEMHLTPDFSPYAHDLILVFASLLKGFQGFNAGEMDTALKDLPLQEPREKGRIPVQEAVVVSLTCIYSCIWKDFLQGKKLNATFIEHS